MAIIKEWICFVHGPFESASSACPHGCNTTEQRFFTPPNIRTTGRTANIDKTMYGLMQQHNMTDVRSCREGEAAKRPDQKKVEEVNNFTNEFSKRFGSSNGWGALDSRNINNSLRAIGAPSDNIISKVKDSLKPLSEMTIPIRDPQNLKLEK